MLLLHGSPLLRIKKGREKILSRPVFCENLWKLYQVFYMGDCGSSSAGKGRPALPDQPEEKEEDPLPMPDRI